MVGHCWPLTLDNLTHIFHLPKSAGLFDTKRNVITLNGTDGGTSLILLEKHLIPWAGEFSTQRYALFKNCSCIDATFNPTIVTT